MSHADLTKQLAKEWNDLEEKDKKVLLLKFIFSEMMFFDVYGVALYLFMFVNVFMQRESCSEWHYVVYRTQWVTKVITQSGPSKNII